MNSKKIKIGGLDIHYFTCGQGEPLVILHGGGNGSQSWLQNARELSRHYTVYIPDLPGFGLSQSIGNDFHLSEFVMFLDNFSRSLGIKYFHLLGHSIGGCIALHYAFQFPHKIKKLVLVSSICLGREIAPWVRFLSSSTLSKFIGLTAISIIKAIRWWGSLFYAPFKYVNPLPKIKLDIGKRMITFKGQTTVLLHQLSDLLVPTLIVWGAKDRIVPAKQAYAAARQIPDCQLHIIKNCGHTVHKHNVQDFSRLLTDFLG